MVSEYTFSGSLPENATTYVTRLADSQLYAGLKAGKFCYVLNSRQMGKSSLRVRTMGRLRREGIKCAAIDLSFDEVQEVKPEQWYVGLIDTLIESFDLDVDLEEFWEKRPLLSALRRFRLFIEEVLLREIEEQIVIFIDEIDGVLRLDFPTDDFFAFIRACHNQRVDNPLYNRLTFCLLGVASPGNLIKDKQRTPFNIGQGISLSGFQLDEVDPLVAGLVFTKAEVFRKSEVRRQEEGEGKVGFSEDDAKVLIKEILYWTGGQPFLTQKLCNLVLNHSCKQENKGLNRKEELRLIVEEVVREKIIDNWQGQDEPEHLRTIQNRILEDESKAGYLLELYQRLWQAGELATNNSTEQSELSLSGLVVRQDGKLTIYNPIYREVFNQDWLEQKLNNLRPYSENFLAWVDSKGQDQSRLLRGKALEDALVWAETKSLSHQDSEFLAASRELEREAEIAEKERLAELEREKKDREAAEERNLVLAEANSKAKRRIFVGGVVLGITLLGAIATGFFAEKQVSTAKNDVTEAISEKEEAESLASEAMSQRDEAKEKELEFQKRAVNFQSEAEKHKQQGEEEKAKATLLANQNQRLAADNQNATQQIEKAQQQQQNLEKQVKSLSSETQKLASQRKDLQTQLAESQNELMENESKSKELEAQLTKVEKNLSIKQEELAQAEEKLEPMQTYLATVQNLAKLAGQLQEEGEDLYSKELLILAGVSARLENNPQLRQAMVLAGISLAYQKTKKPNLEEARKYITESKQKLQNLNNQNSELEKQVRFFTLQTDGNLYRKQGNKAEAIKSYTQAFDVLNSLKERGNRGSQAATISPPFANLETKILSKETVENFHRGLINLLSNSNNEYEGFDCTEEPQKHTYICLTKESLKEHYLDELNNYLANQRWEEADRQTDKAMNASARIKGHSQWYETVEYITGFSCPDLKAIDQLWLDYSDNNFGFSVQWAILKPKLDEVGLYLDEAGFEIDKSDRWRVEEFGKFSGAFVKFIEQVGWYDNMNRWLSYQEVMSKVVSDSSGIDGESITYTAGILPSFGLKELKEKELDVLMWNDGVGFSSYNFLTGEAVDRSWWVRRISHGAMTSSLLALRTETCRI